LNPQRFNSADQLLGELLSRAQGVADDRARRAKSLRARRDAIVAACLRLGPSSIRPLDGLGLPAAFKSVAVDGAHISDVDSSSSLSVSVAFALRSHGHLVSSACLASFGHVFGLEDVSSGLMFMQEIMLATAMAEEDRSSLVVVDGARVSTLIALDSFYRACATGRESQLSLWRSRADAEPRRLVEAFEDPESDWIYKYLTAPNIVASTKLVTSRRLCEGLAGLVDAELAAALRDVDDKSIAEIALDEVADGCPGEGMGPIPLRPPRTPFGVKSGGAAGYPRPGRVDSALNRLSGRPEDAPFDANQDIGFNTLYVRPLPGRAPFSLEVNNAFWSSEVAGALSAGREGDPRTRAMRGLAAYVRQETPSREIMEPYLVHVADRHAKTAVTSAKSAWDFVSRSRVGDGLDWRLALPHRT
jgi:hypothetical protein